MVELQGPRPQARSSCYRWVLKSTMNGIKGQSYWRISIDTERAASRRGCGEVRRGYGNLNNDDGESEQEEVRQ